MPTVEISPAHCAPFVLSKQTASQLADSTQLFFGQALRSRCPGTSGGRQCSACFSHCVKRNQLLFALSN
ncbi:hypothetical protein ELG83_36085 [Rhizobium leguminosarum]|nr:hypothetical protein ELG92_36035 [Rhizobium leguminosarum]TBF23604.1 hypothetical protein ELG88_35415 [Rhizobium leguminosarum]TBF45419.1 hypothetical protein ELG87_35650 [Rhizobium leguminosarum]TBF47198.1 hypothetical protein ELG91_28870 [Rhizobium leguminosarum]TBF64387.1 hypothetical protein ELG89_35905 [Rhizobium leguminosarum]